MLLVQLSTHCNSKKEYFSTMKEIKTNCYEDTKGSSKKVKNVERGK